jgi:anaerobic selenocysteine-containing dehydrogenase
VVEDGRFTRLEPDPAHPIGQALCAKGRAAPELVYHPERLTHPLRRTRPKGDPDPGWERIDWDEALDLIAAAMRRIAERQGPEAVAFSMCSGSTTAIGDSTGFIQRLMNALLTHGRTVNGYPGSPMTLGNAAAAHVRLIVWCNECQHRIEPDAAEMAARR